MWLVVRLEWWWLSRSNSRQRRSWYGPAFSASSAHPSPLSRKRSYPISIHTSHRGGALAGSLGPANIHDKPFFQAMISDATGWWVVPKVCSGGQRFGDGPKSVQLPNVRWRFRFHSCQSLDRFLQRGTQKDANEVNRNEEPERRPTRN
jgi:hypothetical protein